MLCGSGWALALVVRDLGVGTSLLDRALMLNSNLAEAWRCSGWMKNWLGDPKLAIEHYARAMRLSPLGRWLVDIQCGIAHAHFFLDRYYEAASWAAMAMQNNPDFQAGVRIGAASNAMAGRPQEAHGTAVRLQRLNPGRVFRISSTCLAFIDVPKTWRDTRRDCGKPGCPSDIPTDMPRRQTKMRLPFMCRCMGRSDSMARRGRSTAADGAPDGTTFSF